MRTTMMLLLAALALGCGGAPFTADDLLVAPEATPDAGATEARDSGPIAVTDSGSVAVMITVVDSADAGSATKADAQADRLEADAREGGSSIDGSSSSSSSSGGSSSSSSSGSSSGSSGGSSSGSVCDPSTCASCGLAAMPCCTSTGRCGCGGGTPLCNPDTPGI